MNLKNWIIRERIKKGAFARRVGISHNHLSSILHGRCLPSLPVAIEIEKATLGEVTPRDFILAPADSERAPAASPAE